MKKSSLWLMVFIAVATFFFSCKSEEEKKNEMTAQLSTVKKGDVFSVKEDNHYTLYRIKDIIGDSVYFSGSKLMVDAPGELVKIDESGHDDFHLDETLVFSKTQLKSMIETGNILNIHKR